MVANYMEAYHQYKLGNLPFDGNFLSQPSKIIDVFNLIDACIKVKQAELEEKEKRKENELSATAKSIFAQKRYYTYQELTDKLQEYLDVKERTAKGYIKFMREKDIILKDPSKTNYFVIGHS